MSEGPIGFIIILVILIILSAFFSSAEMAFSNLNKIRLRNSASEGKKGSNKALYITENLDKTITTILIGNTVVNIAAASIFTAVILDIFGSSNGLLISTFAMSFIILTFGEILPKSIAKERAESYALKISGILYVLIILLTPISFIFTKLKDMVSNVFNPDKETLPSVTEDEIKVMVDISEEEGVINKNEKELLHRSIDFNEILVGEIYTHRLDMVTIEVNQPLEEVKQLLLEERYSRIPVYEDHIDNIIGFLSEREFFTAIVKNQDFKLRDLIRKPIFVVKSMKISSLLPELQKTKSHMAIVLDEFGGTAGLITMEDILEELVGEIWDEHDEKINMVSKISEDVYEFDAQYHLEDFADVFQIKLPDSSYYNVGGWVFEQLSGIPVKGQIIFYENLKITVLEVDNHRLQKVRVERINEPDETNAGEEIM